MLYGYSIDHREHGTFQGIDNHLILSLELNHSRCFSLTHLYDYFRDKRCKSLTLAENECRVTADRHRMLHESPLQSIVQCWNFNQLGFRECPPFGVTYFNTFVYPLNTDSL